MTEKELYRQTLERALLSGDAMKRRILRESDAENVSPAREMGCGVGNAAPRLHRRRLSRSLYRGRAARMHRHGDGRSLDTRCCSEDPDARG